MVNKEKASSINANKDHQGIEEIIARKKMPVSYIKMNNSFKKRHKQVQKKPENIAQKHLQKQEEELLK